MLLNTIAFGQFLKTGFSELENRVFGFVKISQKPVFRFRVKPGWKHYSNVQGIGFNVYFYSKRLKPTILDQNQLDMAYLNENDANFYLRNVLKQ